MRQLRPIQEHSPYIERYRGKRHSRMWLYIVLGILAAVAHTLSSIT